MTDIQVLLENVRVLAAASGGSLLMSWGIFYFFRQLFGPAGRDPVKIAIAALVIGGAGLVFAMIPGLISVGNNTGHQITGGGYSSMPAPLTLADAGATAEAA